MCMYVLSIARYTCLCEYVHETELWAVCAERPQNNDTFMAVRKASSAPWFLKTDFHSKESVFFDENIKK